MAVLRVREAFACDDRNGVQRVYRQGDLLDSSDPIVTPGRMAFLESVEVAANRSVTNVEQATAAPNVPRTLSTRKKTENG